MIKLTREELTMLIRNKIAIIADEISKNGLESGNSYNASYWAKQNAEEMRSTVDLLLELYSYNMAAEFELVPIEYSEEDLNPDSMETCEVEIPDVGSDCNIPFFRGAPDGVGLKCVSHPDTESPEYLKFVIREHVADADRREEKIELLNKMIVDLERQHDADSKKWGKEVMEAHTEIDRLNKLIRSPSLVEQVDELNRIIAEKETKIAELIKQKDYYKEYFPQQQEMAINRNRQHRTDSPTSGG